MDYAMDYAKDYAMDYTKDYAMDLTTIFMLPATAISSRLEWVRRALDAHIVFCGAFCYAFVEVTNYAE